MGGEGPGGVGGCSRPAFVIFCITFCVVFVIVVFRRVGVSFLLVLGSKNLSKCDFSVFVYFLFVFYLLLVFWEGPMFVLYRFVFASFCASFF